MMETAENRDELRDSLFLSADISVFGSGETQKIRVRNLSAGGMKAEGELPVSLGEHVVIHLSNIGDVPGEIAWKKEGSFGIAFSDPIDPKLARKPVSHKSVVLPRHIRAIPVRRTGLK